MSVKRFKDLGYFNFSTYSVKTSSIVVKCPKCGSKGKIIEQDDRIKFSCLSCMHRLCKEDKPMPRFSISGICKWCGDYFCVDTNESRHKKLFAKCPRCNKNTQGIVRSHDSKYYFVAGDIKNGIEPYFGFELYYLDEFRSKQIWALNDEHLDYLIDYISADLRESPNEYFGSKTQSDHLPKFMKLAKNKDALLKKLIDLKEEI